MNSFKLNIVTASEEVYSGDVFKLSIKGIMGELEVRANHSPLLTGIFPGAIWIVDSLGENVGFVVHGGILEVQPSVTTVLADTILRSKDLDEEVANAAKVTGDALFSKSKSSFDFEKARSELAIATAQLEFLKRISKK
jgi:F-type H+-transporting ATPase subunit epsilon